MRVGTCRERRCRPTRKRRITRCQKAATRTGRRAMACPLQPSAARPGDHLASSRSARRGANGRLDPANGAVHTPRCDIDRRTKRRFGVIRGLARRSGAALPWDGRRAATCVSDRPPTSAAPTTRNDFSGGSNEVKTDCGGGRACRRTRRGRRRRFHHRKRRDCRSDGVLARAYSFASCSGPNVAPRPSGVDQYACARVAKPSPTRLFLRTTRDSATPRTVRYRAWNKV